MSITTHDAVNGNGLFDILGKAFATAETLNTARATTVPTSVTALLTQFQNLTATLDFDAAMEGISTAEASWEQSGSILTAQLQENAKNILIQFVQEDSLDVAPNLVDCLSYLIEEMEDGNTTGGDYVTAPTVSVVVAEGSNTGDAVLAATILRGDGQDQQNAYDEVLTGTATGATAISVAGEVAQTDRMAGDWPLGSGAATTVALTRASNSLLTNGDFATATIDDTPDDWMITTGTIGTTIRLSTIEVQTVTISGTPTGGSYILLWDNGTVTRATVPLAHDATASQVQAALRAIPGLELVTVSSTGTSPNFAHTITFTGVQGNPAELTSVDALTGGTPNIAHATSEAGESASYTGHSLVFVSNGSETTTIYHPLPTLTALTPYFVNFRIRPVWYGSPAAGALEIAIVDGIGGTITTDLEGNDNKLDLTVNTLSDSVWTAENFAFSLPTTTSQPVYLRIRISSAIDDGTALYFDQVALAQGTLLYPGGPFVAGFAGMTPAVATDTWTLTTSNNRNGEFQEWFNRFFGMADNRLLLPTSGASLLDDALIS